MYSTPIDSLFMYSVHFVRRHGFDSRVERRYFNRGSIQLGRIDFARRKYLEPLINGAREGTDHIRFAVEWS